MHTTKQKLFHKDFLLMVIGQIISLFGNVILRFALPLYLLNQTGSPALLGIVGAVSFIPAILLSPIGGIIADRVNKRNIMVVLDFFTCGVTTLFLFLLGQVSLVPLMVVTMMLLYGIQGAYSPSVQASVPALMRDDQLVQANSVVNLVQSMANLVGPVLGGLLYGLYGLPSILIVAAACFFLSAVMEIFIKIPHNRAKTKESALQMVKGDFGQSIQFFKSRPVIGKGVLTIAAFNIFLSAMLMVGMPVLVTQVLPFEEILANQLYGYAQGFMGVGGLLGALIAGATAKKSRYENMWKPLFACPFTLLPVILSLLLGAPAMVSYAMIALCGFLIMLLATMFQVQVLSFTQLVTPSDVLGKIISVIMALCMCAQPVGQAMYGLLFDYFLDTAWVVLLFSAIAAGIVSLFSRRAFAGIPALMKELPAKPEPAIA